MRHMTHRYLRKPIAAITLAAILPGAYDGMMVICDDGATFVSFPDGDRQREWHEGSPIPGTVRSMNLGGVIPIRDLLSPEEMHALQAPFRKTRKHGVVKSDRRVRLAHRGKAKRLARK